MQTLQKENRIKKKYIIFVSHTKNNDKNSHFISCFDPNNQLNLKNIYQTGGLA